MKRPRRTIERSGGGPATPRPHSIADHAFGADSHHDHDSDEEHDHDHDGMDLLPLGGSSGVVLTSVGIDIGSSGTQIVFSRLHPQATRASGRAIIYRSPVYLTPFIDNDRMDVARLEEILSQSFASAGLSPEVIDCGVVILTGAAAERANARAIAETFAEMTGDIVAAAAGHHMEAHIAAHGSGAVQRSAEFAQRYLNIDIGGATTKLAVCDHGVVIATAALAIGGRLVATDATDRIIRLEPSGSVHARRLGFEWCFGGAAPWPERKSVGEALGEMLVAALTGKLLPEELDKITLTGALPSLENIAGIIVSGGVGEYVYGRETRSFSDIGLPLGRALARAIDAGRLPWPLLTAEEPIRATAIGAASYSVQLSGSTGLISAPARLLPRRNLPAVIVLLDRLPIWTASHIAAAITAALVATDSDMSVHATSDIVVALRVTGPPEHDRIAALAHGITTAMSNRLAAGRPLYVVLDADIAASLGSILQSEIGLTNDLLVLDGIALADFDRIDLGRIRLPSATVPVTIKSLVFRDEAGQNAARGDRRMNAPTRKAVTSAPQYRTTNSTK